MNAGLVAGVLLIVVYSLVEGEIFVINLFKKIELMIFLWIEFQFYFSCKALICVRSLNSLIHDQICRNLSLFYVFIGQVPGPCNGDRSRPCLQYHEPLYVRRGGMCRRMLYGRNHNHPLHHVFWPRVQLLWLQRRLPVLWGWDLWRYRMLCWRHDSSSIEAAILSPTGSAGRRVGIPTSDFIRGGGSAL